MFLDRRDKPGDDGNYRDPTSRSAMCSAIITVVRWVLARTTLGMTEASITRRPSRPSTRQSESTTAPKGQVLVPCWVSPALARR